MNAQKTFDTVATHLIRQGRRSTATVNGSTDCAYRGRGGRKCAVGCLVPDDLYDPEMEGLAAWALYRFPKLWKRIKEHEDLLVKLQTLHDERVPRTWHAELGLLAQYFGLNVDALERAVWEREQGVRT